MDVTKSLVRDPNDVPAAKSPELETVVTSWRPDKLKDMTYTQFWQLISERQIERVRCSVLSANCQPARLVVWPCTSSTQHLVDNLTIHVRSSESSFQQECRSLHWLGLHSFCGALQVEFTHDKRSVEVTTKDTAPGGRRTEKVGLPYDPDLFDHMVSHGVVVEVMRTNGAQMIASTALQHCGNM